MTNRLALPILMLVALALMAAIGWVGAPGASSAELMGYLALAGLFALAVASGALLWLRRSQGSLWLQLAVTYAAGVAVSLMTVLLTVQAMLFSTSDLPLLTLLLLFAGVISLGMGMGLAGMIGRRVGALRAGAQRLAEGDLGARVAEHGGDDLAELARDFNRMAAQLAAAAAERERQEAARRDLVVAVSHDLRTPLASLRVLTEALSDGLVDDPATVERYLGTMRGQIGLLSGLIDDLFELAQLDAGALAFDMQRVAPGDLISDVINGLLPQAEAKGVGLGGAVPTAVGPVRAAPQKIERVLYNLVANAIRHTPAGGRVTLGVTKDAADSGLIPSCIVFEVADSGEGIAAEDLPHVFERFYRGEKSRSRATGGAGLGLAIARGIVEAHGGQIWIESARGRGTTVRFSLPAAP
ncbi:HAMP domain-containing protein [Oscillochloris sp. ZM17-4]|uniref:HAMP domain-containing sensor histidine kinase n=1 Tax=Oscillochloris sp. ZM17-4 TaxID=2866714 RepID=UPI001C72B9E1|nr:sensor histidine kinase [Oscillochloris sp. ZM17-4]MBX0327705.1 HAMP domain-containing protein [Oscillochloris sp. ZM17-4]